MKFKFNIRSFGWEYSFKSISFFFFRYSMEIWKENKFGNLQTKPASVSQLELVALGIFGQASHPASHWDVFVRNTWRILIHQSIQYSYLFICFTISSIIYSWIYKFIFNSTFVKIFFFKFKLFIFRFVPLNPKSFLFGCWFRSNFST